MHRTLRITPLTSVMREYLEEQTKGLIQGLGNLRDALRECAGKACSKLTCQEIQDNLGRATEYNSQLDDPKRYETLRRGMIDFAQPIFQASRNGDAFAIQKKNLVLAMLEREVARNYLPINLLIALHFPLSEQVVATLEALRILQGKLDTLDRGFFFRNFDHEEFCPGILSEWLREIPSNMRKELWRSSRSAIETLFLFAYRNNVTRAQEQCDKWLHYRESPAPERSYRGGTRYEYDGGLLIRYHEC